jgi:predicted nucleic acid-binding protein
MLDSGRSYETNREKDVFVIAQLAYWVRTKEGRQRQALQAWLTRLVDALHGRIHGFNVSVPHVWAEQERLLDKAGHQRMRVEDSYIAATARRHGSPSTPETIGISSGLD